MIALLVEFILLSLVIVIAGTFLARFADQLGALTGLGRSMTGIVLLAAATSLPELVVGCNAALISAVDLTVGDLLGSSLCNLLILAVLDMLTRTRGAMLSKAAAAHALSATSSILLTVIVLLFLLLDVTWTIFRVGPCCWAILIAYLFSLRLIYLDQQVSMSEVVEKPDLKGITLRRAAGGYAASAAAIFLAAPRLAGTANELAEITGMGTTFFGTAFVALVTSLPEAVTTLAALRMGAVDMAVGNILGSNSFNMVALFGVDLFYDGSLLAAASDVHAVTAGAVILVTAVTVQGLLYRAEKRFWILEPDALLVILLVLGSMTLVYTVG